MPIRFHALMESWSLYILRQCDYNLYKFAIANKFSIEEL